MELEIYNCIVINSYFLILDINITMDHKEEVQKTLIKRNTMMEIVLKIKEKSQKKRKILTRTRKIVFKKVTKKIWEKWKSNKQKIWLSIKKIFEDAGVYKKKNAEY